MQQVTHTGAGSGRESGQTTAEYAVLMTVITLAVLATLLLLSGSIQNTIQTVIGFLCNSPSFPRRTPPAAPASGGVRHSGRRLGRSAYSVS